MSGFEITVLVALAVITLGVWTTIWALVNVLDALDRALVTIKRYHSRDFRS